MQLTGRFDQDTASFRTACGAGGCFDVKERQLNLGGRRAIFIYISSLSSDEMLERLLSAYLTCAIEKGESAAEWCSRTMPLGNLTLTDDLTKAGSEVRGGNSALLVEGFDELIVTDTKSIPTRSIDEPEHDQVLRGAREGFVENLMINLAVLRRRLSSPNLRLEQISVGDGAPTNLALCYIEGRADPAYVKNIRDKLNSIHVDALSLGMESLAECLIHRKWYNIFPKFRYTERPDAAAATLLEGSLILLCDTSPQAMILPTGILDFVQETDDFYFPPLLGTYLRLLRSAVFFLSLFLTPLWYLLIKNDQWIPHWLDFIRIEENNGLPILFQLLLVEFTIDGLKMASLNTPNMLGNSLSVVAGLILGDFAIQVGWLIPEVILYMAFVSMANFAQPSFELGYAFKFMRILLLIAVEVANLWGFLIGLALILLCVVCNKTVDGSRSYLYPLIPFNGKALFRQIFRVKLKSNVPPKKK